MNNNDIISNFDGEKDPDVKISLSKIDDDVIAVSSFGQINTYNSQYFMNQIKKVLDFGYSKIIFLNGGIQYLSSTGIGAFTSLLKETKMRRGDFVMVNVQPRVYEIFQLLGFSNFFNFANSIEEAMMILRKQNIAPPPVFPKIINCPSCNVKLRCPKNGKYRCSKCRMIISVNEKGEVSF